MPGIIIVPELSYPCIVLAAAGRESSDTAPVRGAGKEGLHAGGEGPMRKIREILAQPAHRTSANVVAIANERSEAYRLATLRILPRTEFRFHSRLAGTRLCLRTLMRIQQR
jgi:hypothetical protein